MDEQDCNASHHAEAVILVVDDDPGQRDILKLILSGEGYKTHVASSAEEALGNGTFSRKSFLMLMVP